MDGPCLHFCPLLLRLRSDMRASVARAGERERHRKNGHAIAPFMHLSDDALEAVLEPLDRLVALDLVRGADGGLSPAALGDTLSRTGPAVGLLVGCLQREKGLGGATHMQQ